MIKYELAWSDPMSTIERLTITVPAEMAASVRQAVEAGGYASTSEVVREALRDWTRHHDTERRELEALREAIRVGFDSGPGIPAEDVYAELRAVIAERRAAQA
jgi:antitoxin ParD1/3/4